MKKMKKELQFATRAIHVGSELDQETGAVIPPIYQTSTFAHSSPGEHKGYEYTRSHNPTRSRLENCLATLENAEHALVTASALSASALILELLEKNASVLSCNDLYGGSFRLFDKVYSDRLHFHYADFNDLKQVEQAIKQHKPALIWLESITNPCLSLCDIEAVVGFAKEQKALVVVDNTMLSPYLLNPLDLGADLVLHSATKYINGHSDVVAGVIMMNDEALREKLFFLQNAIGPCQSPLDSWLVLRGVKTLAIRMEKSQENAMKIANYLENHPQVEKTLYLGLSSHPQYSLAQNMIGEQKLKGFGGMVTFYFKGSLQESKDFLSRLKIFTLAESLGGVESLIEHPAIMTHASIPKEIREQVGVHDNLIRISAGIEEADDLISDLKQAFS
jgi:cystathionine gamma-lyase